jgi:hypothetical protein
VFSGKMTIMSSRKSKKCLLNARIRVCLSDIGSQIY